jgi:tRNA pseudouridine13 synthase
VKVRVAMEEGVLEERVRAHVGIPNYFGHQRFGQNGRNLDDALAFVARKKRAKSRRDRFITSVFQSAVFNFWLHHRLGDGHFPQPLVGDWMVAEGKAAPRPFACEDLQRVVTEVDQGEVSVAGPLVGHKLRPPHSDAMTWESRIWERLGTPFADLVAHPALSLSGRRSSRVLPGEVSTSWQPDCITLSFTLPPGAYATVFISEVVGRPLKDVHGGVKPAPP